MAGCSALPDKPLRPVQYDFGPGSVAQPADERATPLPTLALAEVEGVGRLEAGTAVLYRLGYEDDRQLRPYALARWSVPPAQLVRGRLREQLSQRRMVIDAGEGAALLRSGGHQPLVLRLALEEFSQLFSSPTSSVGLVRVRATLVDNLPAGEKLLAQRRFVLQRPAVTADAPGGVRALAEATDALAADLAKWLQTVER